MPRWMYCRDLSSCCRPADHELVFLNGYIELVTGESGHRQRDPQSFGLAVRPVAPLDIVGRIAVGAFDDAIERTLDLVEAKKERTGKRGNTRHFTKSSRSDFGISGPGAAPLGPRLVSPPVQGVTGACGLHFRATPRSRGSANSSPALNAHGKPGLTNRPTIYLNEIKPPATVHGVVFRVFDRSGPRNGQASIRFRPSPAEKMQLRPDRGDPDPLADGGPSVPGIRTMTSPGGSSPGVAATPLLVLGPRAVDESFGADALDRFHGQRARRRRRGSGR